MLKNGIKTWAVDDQPREKLLLKGAETLSTAELIAILINNGTRTQSALDLAKALMGRVHNQLPDLAKLTVNEMVNLGISGIGTQKATTILAALELGVRRNSTHTKRKDIQKSSDIADWLKSELGHKPMERFVVVYLNRANKIIRCDTISEGGITGTVADPRIILKKALDYHAVSLILCHNHPSGNLKPSKADELLTNKIKNAAAFLDIQVLDHIIVSEEGYYSFADEGMM